MAQRNLKVGAIKDVSGEINIAGGDIYKGYTVEQVSVLLTQITSRFQPKPFDGRCPYKGLEVFEEEDAELFFGRERLVDDLLSRVKESRTVFITGPSGSGKSSLVRAGLLHALKQGGIKNSERWLYEIMKPGREPVKDLALAFSRLKGPDLADYFQARASEKDILNKCAESVLSGRKDQRFVLFVDQFEEVFTQVSRDERLTFLSMLAHAGTVENGRVIVLFAMRSDFVSNCATYLMINELLGKQFLQVGAMQPEELVSAIALPAKHVGLPIEDELIARIINDMKGEPGALPLMQFALKELFDSQQEQGGVIALTLEDYLQHGGVQKSLERHADSSFAKLSEDEQELARSIFSGLIEVGRGTDDTRRTALFDELVPANAKPDEVEATVRKLADARLIITDEQAGKDTVTISHEKLIDAWPWLKKLVNENRDVIALQNEIADDAKEWEDHNRDPSYLYTGARLANAREQLDANTLVLSGLGQEYVGAGIARQKRGQLVLVGGISTVIALLIAAVIIFAGLTSEAQKQAAIAQAASTRAVAQEATAQANAEEAQNQANIALSNQLTAKSQTELLAYHDRRLSLLFAIEAINAAKKVPGFQNIAAEQALRDAIHQTGGDVILSPASEDALAPRGNTALSTLGDRLAIGYENKIYVWNLNDPQQRPEILPTSSSVGWLLFSPDGKFLVMLSTQAQAEIWDMENLSQKPRIVILPPLSHGYTPVEFSPDGGWLLITFDTILNLSDVNAKPFDFPNTFVSAIGLQGRWLVTRDPEDGYLYLSDTYDPGKDPIFLTAEGDCDRVMFSPDGRWLASGCNNVVKVWDVQDIEHQHFPFYFGSPAAFSPDATRLAIIFDGTIRILDLQGNRTERVINLYGQRFQLHNLRFSPDNLWIAATDAVGTIFLWDLTSGALITLNGLGGSERAVSDIAFTADSRQLISVSDDGITRKWELLNPYAASLRVPLKEITNIDSLSFSSDGRWLAINGWHKDNGDSLGGTLLDLKNWPGDPITLPTSSGALFFSPNGDQAISINEKDNKIRRWDVADIAEGNFIPNSTDVPGKIIVNVQDNHWLISRLEDNTIQVQDLLEPNVKPKSVSAIQTSIADSSTIGTNGKWFWVVSKDQTVQLWDLDHPDKEPEQPPTILKYTHTIKISPSGNLLATISNEDIIQLWDLRKSTQEPIISLQGDARGDSSFLNSLIFSSDEHWLVLNKRTTIQILDLQEPAAAKLITLRGLKEAVGDIVLSSNGHWLAGSSTNSREQRWEIRLWNLQDPTSEPIILQQEDQTRTLVFSPDARWLAIAHLDSNLELLRLDISEVSTLACEIVGSNLSRQQWEANFGPRKDYQKTCPQWPEGTDKRIELPGG